MGIKVLFISCLANFSFLFSLQQSKTTSSSMISNLKRQVPVFSCWTSFCILNSYSTEKIVFPTTLWCISQFEVSTIFFVFLNLHQKTQDCVVFWEHSRGSKIFSSPQIRSSPRRKMFLFTLTFWSTGFRITPWTSIMKGSSVYVLIEKNFMS